VALASFGIVGVSVELAMLRHWTSNLQLIAWLALVALAGTCVLVGRARSPSERRAARVVARPTAGLSPFGVLEHILSNFEAGALDAVCGDQWESLSLGQRWWLAATHGVGPPPPLAPGILLYVGICLLLALRHHPMLELGDKRP